jgi:putative nucleotidyltransferase with HDIG domain
MEQASMPAVRGAESTTRADASDEVQFYPPTPSNIRAITSDPSTRRQALFSATWFLEIALGAILLVLIAPTFEGEWTLFLLLLGLNLLAERTPITIYGDTVITIGFVFTVAMIALVGPAAVVIAAPFEAAARRVGRRSLVDALFVRNALRGVLINAAAAGTYELFVPVPSSELDLRMIPGGLASAAVAFGLSAFLISLSLSLRRSRPISEVWAENRWLGPHYLAFGVVGIALAAAYSGLGYWGIVAFITPAFMLRLSMKQYVDKTSENVEKLRKQNEALQAANKEIRKVSEELVVTYGATLEALVNALEARDQETKGHSVRVAHYMLNIAEALGVEKGTQDWTDMQHGALLHDVGKIGVRDSILLKPGKLTPEEWEYMRKHPEIGYNILREVKFLHGAADIVLAHHERWDGQGYPRGLKREEIPLGSRIFSVVDTFDSMTSDRPYRKAMTPEEALQEILRCGGTQFDPLVVEAFLDIYEAWVIEREWLHGRARVLRPAA